MADSRRIRNAEERRPIEVVVVPEKIQLALSIRRPELWNWSHPRRRRRSAQPAYATVASAPLLIRPARSNSNNSSSKVRVTPDVRRNRQLLSRLRI